LTYSHADAETRIAYSINWTDSTVVSADEVVAREKNYFTGIVNADLAFAGESHARLSTRLFEKNIDLDAAVGLALGPVVADIEVYGEAKSLRDSLGAGCLVGAAYEIAKHLEVAFRYDAIAENVHERAMDNRMAGGITVRLVRGIYTALEYAESFPSAGEPGGAITLQIGLQQNLKVPGFRQRTLSEN
jgi:hypothetical protein